MSALVEGRSRMAFARIVAVVFALVAALLMMGLIDLFTLPGWVDQRYEWQVPLDASWGCLFTFFLAGAYLSVALHPRAPWPALVQLGITALALLLSAAAGTDWRPLWLALGVVVSGLLLWLVVGRPDIAPGRMRSVGWGALAVAVVGLPLWLPYALMSFARSRSGVLGVITQGVEHWPVQGATGVAVVVASLVLACWHDGRSLLRIAVSSSAVYIGMAELAYPDRDGAMGSLRWGVGVTLWGLLVALVAVPDRTSRHLDGTTAAAAAPTTGAARAEGQAPRTRPRRAARLRRIAALGACAAGLCWVVKGGVILTTGVQPPLVFEVAPLLMSVVVLALGSGITSVRRRAGAVIAGSTGAVAALFVLADEVADVPEPLTGGSMALANLAVLTGLAVVGAGRGRERTAGLLPLGLAVATVPAVLLGGLLTLLFGDRALEVPIVVLGATWIALASRLARASDGGVPLVTGPEGAPTARHGVPAPRPAAEATDRGQVR